MWMITTRGMFSAVQHRTDPNTLVVRTRHLADADALAAWASEHTGRAHEPICYEHSDYPWRVMLDRDTWTAFAAAEAAAVDYGNFKSAVAARQGLKREHVYHDVWAALLGLTKLPGALGSKERRKAATRDDGRPKARYTAPAKPSAPMFDDGRSQLGFNLTDDGERDYASAADLDWQGYHREFRETCEDCGHVHEGWECAEDCLDCYLASDAVQTRQRERKAREAGAAKRRRKAEKKA